MTEFRVFETDRFIRMLEGLDGRVRGSIEAKLKEQVYPQLREEPFTGQNVAKLRNYRPETWRYRVGDYRLFYRIDAGDGVVSIVAIHHRKDAYRA